MDKQSLVLTLVSATTARIKKNSALLHEVRKALEEHEKSVLIETQPIQPTNGIHPLSQSQTHRGHVQQSLETPTMTA